MARHLDGHMPMRGQLTAAVRTVKSPAAKKGARVRNETPAGARCQSLSIWQSGSLACPIEAG